MEVKFPKAKVKLTNSDGNAFMIIGKVRKALSKAGATQDQIKEFTDEATSGDYNNVLATCFKWVEVE